MTGRWLSRDPIAENGGVNLYAFCNNDPVNGVDGLGLWGIQFGDFQIGVGDMWMEFRANAEMAEALHGGVSIVTSTLTFGLSDKVKLTDSSQYQGGAFTVSRVGATIGREALITAATLGLGTAARGGSAIAQTAYKGLLVTEAATGGYQAGQGINAVREGDTVNGAIDILAGSLRVGGSILSASEFTKLAKSTASGPASKIHITEAVSHDVQNGVARPAGGVKAANGGSSVGAETIASKGMIHPDRFRRSPSTLSEQLVLEEAKSGAGIRIMDKTSLGDTRYQGMYKMQHVHYNPNGTKTVIHYIVDPNTGAKMDFKFK